MLRFKVQKGKNKLFSERDQRFGNGVTWIGPMHAMVRVIVPKEDRLWQMDLLIRIDVLGHRSCLRKYQEDVGLSVR
jgi:hypothetical protein